MESEIALLTMRLGLDSVLLTGEITIRDDLTTDEIERLMTRLNERIGYAAPEVKNLYLEPHPVPREPSISTAPPFAGAQRRNHQTGLRAPAAGQRIPL